MKSISLLIAMLLASVALGAEEETTDPPDIDRINFFFEDAFYLSTVTAYGDGQTLFRYYVYPVTKNRFSNARVMEMYDAYHGGGVTFEYQDNNTGVQTYQDRLEDIDSSHHHLNFILYPVFEGTTSIERLGKVVAYVKGNANIRATVLAARAGDLSLLKAWSAWLTYNAVLGLSHANRTDTIKWALIEQNLSYTMDEHFSNGNAAKWEEVYTALNTATGFYIVENLTRTRLGLTATDDLPDRLKAPRLVRSSTTNPVTTTAYLDEARTLVLDDEYPYFDATMRGPSAP